MDFRLLNNLRNHTHKLLVLPNVQKDLSCKKFDIAEEYEMIREFKYDTGFYLSKSNSL